MKRESDAKMLAALLTGVNRAFPFIESTYVVSETASFVFLAEEGVSWIS